MGNYAKEAIDSTGEDLAVSEERKKGWVFTDKLMGRGGGMLIEVFYDLTCPWCYIGQRCLREALRRRPGLHASLRWQPYLLHPDLPESGADRSAWLDSRLGGASGAERCARAQEAAARTCGVALTLGRLRRLSNTVNAHRLVAWAARLGRADALVFRLFDLYFQDGRDIGERPVLAAALSDAGLDTNAAGGWLAGSEGFEHFRNADAIAERLRLRAVPSFVVDRRFALTGAPDVASLLPLLDLARLPTSPEADAPEEASSRTCPAPWTVSNAAKAGAPL